jgi:hypothetical protein
MAMAVPKAREGETSREAKEAAAEQRVLMASFETKCHNESSLRFMVT